MNYLHLRFGYVKTGDNLLPTCRHLQMRWRIYLANLAMFLYGVGWSFAIPLVGQLFVAEAIALVTLPFLSPLVAASRFRNLRIILSGYLFLLCGLVVSDVANGTETMNSLRGWANIAFAMINTVFILSALRVSLRSFHYYLIGMFLAMLVFGSASYAQRDGYVDLSIELLLDNFNMFKVRYVPFVMPLLMLIAIYLYRQRPVFASATFGISAIAFFILDARSSGLVLLATAMILLIKKVHWRPSPARLVILGIVMAIAGQFAYITYVYNSLRYNPFGHNASQLMRLENPYNPFELLLTGRSEWLIAADAISDKPLIGHGSWAYDSDGQYGYLLAQKTGTIALYRAMREANLHIPAHSVFVNSWLWGGLLGFIGILIISKTILTLGSSVLRARHVHQYLPAAILLFCGMLWDLLFSPIQSLRLSFPQGLALLLMLQAISHVQSLRTFWKN